jgi:hypothetical protein
MFVSSSLIILAQTLQICLGVPFSALLAQTTIFSSLTGLRALYLSVDPTFSPGTPPLPRRSDEVLPTDSPTRKKAHLPQLLDFDQMQNQTCVPLLPVGDPSLPLLRDVKRFVRKCSKLEFIGLLYPSAGYIDPLPPLRMVWQVWSRLMARIPTSTHLKNQYQCYSFLYVAYHRLCHLEGNAAREIS